ncbi:MAG TPA: ROK family protein [Chryseosolibacter sp.]|nr:ROK family protein [Chryseosolibacter sp.]
MKDNMRHAIGIDLGCTNIKAVLVDGDGNVLQQARHETREHDDQHWKSSVKRMIADLKGKSNGVATVGLCAPGLANAENSFISCMPGRLPGLERFNWSDFTGERVHVLNDAHAALTAEATFGAAKGLKHAVLITLGSGVGGGILIDGHLYQGMSQMAGHFGHMSIDASTHLRDVTNMPGSIEDAIGNITIVQRSYGRYQTTFELIEAYRRGDTFATWLWLDAVRKLSISIASCVNLVSPEAVIIGGGIGQAGEALMKPLREFLEMYEWKPTGSGTVLKAAHFSDMAGAIGAAGFALTKSKQAS